MELPHNRCPRRLRHKTAARRRRGRQRHRPVDVPGCCLSSHLPCFQLIETGLYDAIIVFGCVIRGGTPHFDYVCQSVTQGITALNADCDIPVIFGVLTVDCEQDALDRCGGPARRQGRRGSRRRPRRCMRSAPGSQPCKRGTGLKKN